MSMTSCHIGVIKMPSKTFLNLKEEKKKKLLDAAKKEFSRVRLADASINKIIKEADISRGSFYMYFNDKEDLYAYLLSEHRINGIKILIDCLNRSKGDIIKAYEELYTIFLNKCLLEKEKGFFKNVFQNANLYMENKTGFCCFESNEEKVLFQKLEDAIDKEKLSSEAKESIKDMLMLLFDITIKNVIPPLFLEVNKKEAQHHFQRSLKLIKGGIYK